MSPKNRSLRFGWLSALIGIILLLEACGSSKGGLPACSVDELEQPRIISPEADELIDDLTPTISWTYPGTTCLPEQYKLEVWWSQNYHPGASAGYFTMGGFPTGELFVWPEESPLRPGQTFYIGLKPIAWEGRGFHEGPEARVAFSTGPRCPSGGPAEAPRLRWPDDESVVDPNSGFALEWENMMTCWPDHDFHVQVSTSPRFRSAIELNTPITAVQVHSSLLGSTPLENCTLYYWRARADLSLVEKPPYSEIWTFFTHIPGTACPLGPFITPIPPEGLRIPPSAILNVHANCRSGPGMDYPVVDILEQGTSLQIDGRDQESTWWQVNDLDLQKDCWLAGSVIDISGDVGQVPVIQVAPPPTLVPTDTPVPPVNCAQYNANTCSSNSACTWDKKQGKCVNK